MDTVLCVLTLNIYYEKLFIFLWFWLLFVAIVSTINSMKWVYSLCSSTKAQKVIQNYLSTAPMKSQITDEQFFRTLGPDGLFVMEQMALNLGDIPASYLTISMRNICQNWADSEDEYDDDRQPLTTIKSH
ncbi:unnamed protein product [Caenorhabditis angaria]|uniref:Innexin n=1 Tax=Caenorhabditis angaria TaxID=860376 RepID=A0A9P1N4V9_9PELO|nr:unnamed protein product [Caenorhabditis angaria]